jgi:hypothetical protein
VDQQLVKKTKPTEIAFPALAKAGVHRIKEFVANSVLLTSIFEWKADQRKTKYLCWIIFIACYVFAIFIVYKMIYDLYFLTSGRPYAFGDFFSLWSFKEIARTHPVAELYNSVLTHQRQLALGMDLDRDCPFPYPPSFLLFIWPLGILPYGLSYLFWVTGTLSLFVYAVLKTCSRLPFALGCAVVAPVCIVNIWYGQAGFLTGALLIAGIRSTTTRPIVSGVLLGLLSFKPQLGLLVPLALAAAGLWRTFAVACATVAGLVIISAIAFGPGAWVAWISGLPEYAEWFQRPVPGAFFKISVNDYLHMLGLGSGAALAAQALVSATVASLIWISFRRGSTPLAHAALLTGAIVASPHTIVYDAPMVVASMILFIQARIDTSYKFNLFEILVLLAAFVGPGLLVFKGASFPAITVISFMLLFILLIRSDLFLKHDQFADIGVR